MGSTLFIQILLAQGNSRVMLNIITFVIVRGGKRSIDKLRFIIRTSYDSTGDSHHGMVWFVDGAFVEGMEASK